MKEGLVIKSTGSNYIVQGDDGLRYECKIKGKFRIEERKTTNPVAVGDRVQFSIQKEEDNSLITKIHERRNYIIRKSTNLSKLYHIVAANIDQALVVASLKMPETPSEFIDRYLITAEAYSIPAIILFNKSDLYGPEEMQKLNDYKNVYSSAGYTCVSMSAHNPRDVEELKERVKGKISLISGNSGVGKTTLINNLVPQAKLKTAEISDYHKTGKHTTTFAEMIPLENSGYLIDTPGIRGFGLIEVDKDELFHFFPEIFKHSAHCKYHNCRHINEPGCAVKLAYTNGMISESRYGNYLKIVLEEDEKYR